MFINWNAMIRVNSYQYQIDIVDTFDSDVLIEGQKDYISSSSSNLDTEHYLSNTLFFGKTYYWRVRAIHDTDTCQWTTRDFVTRDYVNLNSPTNETLNVSTSGINLDWYSHWGITYYNLEIDKTNQFNSPDLQQFSKEYIGWSNYDSDTQQHTEVLDENTIYFWRVRARNSMNASDWTVRWFSTGNATVVLPETPILISPENTSENQSTTITFDWQDATNATEYVIEYTDNPSFDYSTQNTSSVSEYTVSNLALNQTYYWRVYASDETNISEWSETWNFTTDNGLGISDFDNNNNKIKTYPNPTNAVFTVRGTAMQSIFITNINGKVIYSSNNLNSSNEFQVDLSMHAKGMYFIKIQRDTIIAVKKVVLE